MVKQDDLIIKYLTEKALSGRIPVVSEEEYMDFLRYFSYRKSLSDAVFDFNYMIERFNKRTNHSFNICSINKNLFINNNFNLSDLKNSSYNDLDLKTKKDIDDIINVYVSSLKKSSINTENIEIISDESQSISAYIINEIWLSIIEEYINNGSWPKQCNDIISYLLDLDLASCIMLDSIKDVLIEFYNCLCKRIEALKQLDNGIILNNYNDASLGSVYYNLLFESFIELKNKLCSKYKISLSNNFIEKITSINNTLSVENVDSNNDNIKSIVRKLNVR